MVTSVLSDVLIVHSVQHKRSRLIETQVGLFTWNLTETQPHVLFWALLGSEHTISSVLYLYWDHTEHEPVQLLIRTLTGALHCR